MPQTLDVNARRSLVAAMLKASGTNIHFTGSDIDRLGQPFATDPGKGTYGRQRLVENFLEATKLQGNGGVQTQMQHIANEAFDL